jgi:hypothetical protein
MDVEKLEKEAEYCRREADRAREPSDRGFWLRIAEGWIELAQKVQKGGSG